MKKKTCSLNQYVLVFLSHDDLQIFLWKWNNNSIKRLLCHQEVGNNPIVISITSEEVPRPPGIPIQTDTIAMLFQHNSNKSEQ